MKKKLQHYIALCILLIASTLLMGKTTEMVVNQDCQIQTTMQSNDCTGITTTAANTPATTEANVTNYQTVKFPVGYIHKANDVVDNYSVENQAVKIPDDDVGQNSMIVVIGNNASKPHYVTIGLFQNHLNYSFFNGNHTLKATNEDGYGIFASTGNNIRFLQGQNESNTELILRTATNTFGLHLQASEGNNWAITSKPPIHFQELTTSTAMNSLAIRFVQDMNYNYTTEMMNNGWLIVNSQSLSTVTTAATVVQPPDNIAYKAFSICQNYIAVQVDMSESRPNVTAVTDIEDSGTASVNMNNVAFHHHAKPNGTALTTENIVVDYANYDLNMDMNATNQMPVSEIAAEIVIDYAYHTPVTFPQTMNPIVSLLGNTG